MEPIDDKVLSYSGRRPRLVRSPQCRRVFTSGSSACPGSEYASWVSEMIMVLTDVVPEAIPVSSIGVDSSCAVGNG